jgi:hypothetical protein
MFVGVTLLVFLALSAWSVRDFEGGRTEKAKAFLYSFFLTCPLVVGPPMIFIILTYVIIKDLLF